MRFVRWRAVVIGAVVAATTVLISGCTTPDPVDSSSPTASSEPVFASDEEALAAAEQAYADYLAMSDLIASEGGADAERMQTVASGEALATAVQDLLEFTEREVRSVGQTSFDITEVERISRESPPSIAFYVCDDVSAVDIVDGSGDSIVSPGRPDLSPFQVRVERVNGLMVVSNRNYWEGENYC